MGRANGCAATAHKPVKGNSSDFLVRIMFRSHFNWQGEILWLETNKKRNFRSSLELLMLMEEAVEESGAPQADYCFRSWKDKGKPQLEEAEPVPEFCLGRQEE